MAKLTMVIFAIVLATVLAKDCEYDGVKIREGGEHFPIGECVRVGCYEGKINKLPCPQIGIPHGCEVIYKGQDLSKPHPDCCAKAYCES